MFDFQRLDDPMRLIAMARIGNIPQPADAGRALNIVREARAHLREQHRSDFDLERPQSVLQTLALGYRPRTHDCVIAVQSLSCRMQDEQDVECEPLAGV